MKSAWPTYEAIPNTNIIVYKNISNCMIMKTWIDRSRQVETS